MSVLITWLGQSGYLLEGAGQRLVLDPYFSDVVERVEGLRRLVSPPCPVADLKPDVLLITHDHLDHFDEETVAAIMQRAPSCRLIGPASVMKHAAKMGLAAARLTPLASGETLALSGITIAATPARHSDVAAVGLLLQVENILLWFSGDTLYAPELSQQILALAPRSPDIACICINGKLGNMNLTEATQLMTELRPRLAVPAHYGMFAENTADHEGFVAACARLGQPAFALPFGRVVDCAALLKNSDRAPSHEGKP
ncbi:MAG: MBL fold metallo-hydrolase [Kiritimatiellaeota bacterium]|nr:MBL fold metallo-hydrolase [Kiritimatiellota bacterium]